MKNQRRTSNTNAIAQLVVVTSLLASGCASSDKSSDARAGWIKGQIVSLVDGVVLPMQIEKKIAFGGSAAGGIAAQNPKTGENLEGQYTGMMQVVGSASSQSGGAITSGGSTANWTQNTQTNFRSNKANAQATLVGNKGTTITFDMEIMAGWSPHGFGQGVDGEGKKYRIQF